MCVYCYTIKICSLVDDKVRDSIATPTRDPRHVRGVGAGQPVLADAVVDAECIQRDLEGAEMEQSVGSVVRVCLPLKQHR